MTDVKDYDEVPGSQGLDEAEDARVRQRAYEIWEKEGRPEGRALEHWFRAKNELGDAPEELRRAEGRISSLGGSD